MNNMMRFVEGGAIIRMGQVGGSDQAMVHSLERVII
jgi:hypothetical protein